MNNDHDGYLGTCVAFQLSRFKNLYLRGLGHV
jgi:hypothetical protein